VQESFVDQPLHAVTDGQDLLASIMKERGYPAEDGDQIAADLSVTHAGTLAHYRTAQDISADAERGDASTEDLRQALLHLRVVFGELLGKPGDAEPAEPVEPGSRVLGAGPRVPGSRVLAGESPDVADREASGLDAADHAPDATTRDSAVREDSSHDGAVRDGAAAGDPVRDGAARDSAAAGDPVRDDVPAAGAGTPEPEEQLWRPGVRVPSARNSTEETTR
jgi:hypothetical protein